MGPLAPASVVVVNFPFSDLSGAKLRPAVVLLHTGRSDWLLCQVTSNPFSDPDAVRISQADLVVGSLATVSFVRPTKLFTADEGLISKRVAVLTDASFKVVLSSVIDKLQSVMPD